MRFSGESSFFAIRCAFFLVFKKIENRDRVPLPKILAKNCFPKAYCLAKIEPGFALFLFCFLFRLKLFELQQGYIR